MFTRRVAAAAVLLTLCGAGCASHGTTAVEAGPGASAAPVLESTTTTATTVPPETTVTTVPAAPVVTAAPKPAAATIAVNYQPHDGGVATATITGPNGSHSKPLDSGAALFGGLPAGTYSVTITIDTPSGDPTVGDARQIINGGNIHVEAGDHGVISCDDNACTGTL
jgi:hypothetical protein